MTNRVHAEQQSITSAVVVVGTGGSMGAVWLKNLGPSTVYIGSGSVTDPPAITKVNSYPLDVGESVEVPAPDDTSYPAFASTVDEDGASTLAILGLVMA